MNSKQKIINILRAETQPRSDIYLIRKWAISNNTPSPILPGNCSEEVRRDAYLHFYKQIKPFKIVSRQTIQRWFGIGGFSMPSRRQFLQCALCLHFSLKETQEYLLHGLSQWDLQINDYEEMICMYCLENDLGPENFHFMVEFFETHTDQELRPLQTARTDILKKTYEKKKNLPLKDFLLWMCHSAELFKGYSMTVYSYYVSLLNEAFTYYQTECREELQTLLSRTDYAIWKTEQNSNDIYLRETEKEHIHRYLKNIQRRKSSSVDPHDLKDIQNLYVIAYAPKARITDLLNQIYHNNQKDSKTWNEEIFALLSDYLGEEIQWENSKYISELLSISAQKEQQMLYQRANTTLKQLSEKDTCPEWICQPLRQKFPDAQKLSAGEAQKIISKELKKQKTRVRNIQRSDFLLLIQYIFSVRYDQQIRQNMTEYDQKEARQAFISLADTILTTCDMREINAQYRLDHLILSCITSEEVILLGDLLDLDFWDEP